MNNLYKILVFACLFYPPILLTYYSYGDSYRYQEVRVNWYHNLNKNQLLRNLSSGDQAVFMRKFFFNKRSLVYYNHLGEAQHKITLDSQSLISPDNDYYMIFPQLSQKVELFNNRGEKQWSLDTYAIPYITPFRKNVFLISSDHNTLTVYDYHRNQILPPTYLGSLITDFTICGNNDSILIGIIEGDLYLFDHQVKQVFRNQYQESRYQYIKSVSCSSSGNRLSILSGLQPENLYLLDQNGKTLWVKNTGLERRSSTDIFVDENNSFVLDHTRQSVLIYSMDGGKLLHEWKIPNQLGGIKRMVFSSIPGWFLIGINGDYGYRAVLLNQNLETVWQTPPLDEYLTYVELMLFNEKIFFQIHTLSSVYSYQLGFPAAM